MSNTQQRKIKTKRQVIACVIAIVFFMYGTSTRASAESIVTQVRQFVEDRAFRAHPDASRINVHVKAPDPQLNLEACTHPAISLHGNDLIRSRVLVRLNCQQSIALHLAVDIGIFKSVLVAATSLARQSQVSAEDLRHQEINILTNSVGRHLLTGFDEAIGKQLKRSVRAGTILTSGMLSQPKMVIKGDSVVIIARKGALVVRMPGTALASGTKGQQIRVKNQSSSRIIKGWIQAPGEVVVPF
jgi:flagella basal body P-ring formation protein FlgA